jgi:cytidylate kinase
MYRAVTLFLLKNSIDYKDNDRLQIALQQIELDFNYNSFRDRYETILNQRIVEDEIRKSDISDKVSEVSALAPVRNAMVKKQRELAKSASVVMDGRDIGTTVFPDADLKIFMTADLLERARRRKLDLEKLRDNVDFDRIVDNLKSRDYQDMNRQISPLRKAEDAIEIDTSKLTFDQQVSKIIHLATEQIKQKT